MTIHSGRYFRFTSAAICKCWQDIEWQLCRFSVQLYPCSCSCSWVVYALSWGLGYDVLEWEEGLEASAQCEGGGVWFLRRESYRPILPCSAYVWITSQPPQKRHVYLSVTMNWRTLSDPGWIVAFAYYFFWFVPFSHSEDLVVNERVILKWILNRV